MCLLVQASCYLLYLFLGLSPMSGLSISSSFKPSHKQKHRLHTKSTLPPGYSYGGSTIIKVPDSPDSPSSFHLTHSMPPSSLPFASVINGTTTPLYHIPHIAITPAAVFSPSPMHCQLYPSVTLDATSHHATLLIPLLHTHQEDYGNMIMSY